MAQTRLSDKQQQKKTLFFIMYIIYSTQAALKPEINLSYNNLQPSQLADEMLKQLLKLYKLLSMTNPTISIPIKQCEK